MKKFMSLGALALLTVATTVIFTSCDEDIYTYGKVIAPTVQVTHSISGLITDMSGAAISGATVTMDSSETTTDSDGTYTFEDVSVGTHTMTAAADGKLSKSETLTVESSTSSTNLQWNVALSNEGVTVEVSTESSTQAETTSEVIENNDEAVVTTTMEAEAASIETEEESVTISLTTIYSEDDVDATSRATTRASENMMLIGTTISCSDPNAKITTPITLTYNIDSDFQDQIEARKYVNGSWQTMDFTALGTGGVSLQIDAFTSYSIVCTVNVTTTSTTTDVTLDQSSWDNTYGKSSVDVSSVNYTYNIGTNITTSATNKVTAYLVELLARLTSATYVTTTGSYPINVTLPSGTGMTLTATQAITTYTVSSKSYQATGQQYGNVSFKANTYSRSHTGGSN